MREADGRGRRKGEKGGWSEMGRGGSGEEGGIVRRGDGWTERGTRRAGERTGCGREGEGDGAIFFFYL